jgi:acyl dehydratase
LSGVAPSPGDELPPYVVESVSVEAMKTMAALLRDPNPIHFDVDAVRALGMGDRPVNQGPSNMAYVVSMLSAYAGGPDRIRRLRVRFLGNVLGGDRVVARGRVASVSGENGERLAEVEVWLERAEDDRVLEGTAVVSIG